MERETGPATNGAGRTAEVERVAERAGPGGGAALEAVDIQQLLALLPHRYPFLMVDRIVDLQVGHSAVGIKNVSVNEPHFAGHFPGRPIMPGVLILEGMAQTCGALAIRSRTMESPPVVFLTSIDQARFRKLVVPGDVLRYHVVKKQGFRNVWKFVCEAQVDGTRVAEAVITAMIAAD